jgi:hypothetical protein
MLLAVESTATAPDAKSDPNRVRPYRARSALNTLILPVLLTLGRRWVDASYFWVRRLSESVLIPPQCHKLVCRRQVFIFIFIFVCFIDQFG